MGFSQVFKGNFKFSVFIGPQQGQGQIGGGGGVTGKNFLLNSLRPGVSILQENFNYSPVLSVIYKILPQILLQLQSYRCLLSRSLDPSFLFFCDDLLGGGSITVPNAHFSTQGGV